MKSLMIIGIIFLVGFFIIGIAIWRKVRTPKPALISTSTTPAPAATAAAPPAAKSTWAWLKWLLIAWTLLTIAILSIAYLSVENDLKKKEAAKEAIINMNQPSFSADSKIHIDFTPNHVGEWKIGRVKGGIQYRYDVVGQYLKIWDDGTSMLLDAAVGINHPVEQKWAPFPENNYGVIFIRIGKNYIFPGGSFYAEKDEDVYAEPNLVRKTHGNSYKNYRPVSITIDTVPENKPDAS
jgi:hypothetical protein